MRTVETASGPVRGRLWGLPLLLVIGCSSSSSGSAAVDAAMEADVTVVDSTVVDSTVVDPSGRADASAYEGAVLDGAAEVSVDVATGANTDAAVGADASVTSGPEFAAYLKQLVERCAAILDDAVSEESVHAARVAYARGDTDIALSVQGCTRLYVERSGTVETFSALVGPPFGYTFDPTVEGYIRASASTLAFRSNAGGLQVAADLDADGVVEMRETVVTGASRHLERVGADGRLLARSHAVVAEGRRISVVEEELVDERLSVTARYDTAQVARKCEGDPPPTPPPPPTTPPRPVPPFPESPHEVPCSQEQLALLDTLLDKAAGGGTSCLAGAGMPDLRFRLLAEVARTSFDFKCTDDPSFVAANDGGYGRIFPGRARLWINTAFFGGQPAEQIGTLFHELLHFFQGHDHDVEALASYATNLAYADRVYACEALCFGTKPNRCHLAACKGKKVCEVDSSSFEQQTKRTLASCWTGHQVGALCRKPPGQRLWCTTQSECEAACGGPCESKSISCDDDCR